MEDYFENQIKCSSPFTLVEYLLEAHDIDLAYFKCDFGEAGGYEHAKLPSIIDQSIGPPDARSSSLYRLTDESYRVYS